jgi:hypothetical protein
VTEEVSRQRDGSGEIRGRTLPFVGRVAGWLIVPLYVAGVCTSSLLERVGGWANEHLV